MTQLGKTFMFDVYLCSCVCLSDNFHPLLSSALVCSVSKSEAGFLGLQRIGGVWRWEDGRSLDDTGFEDWLGGSRPTGPDLACAYSNDDNSRWRSNNCSYIDSKTHCQYGSLIRGCECLCEWGLQRVSALLCIGQFVEPIFDVESRTTRTFPLQPSHPVYSLSASSHTNLYPQRTSRI